jgi:esterase/lipase superfamily enzyme
MIVGCAKIPKRADYPRRLPASKSGMANTFDFFYATQRVVAPDRYFTEDKEYTPERTSGLYCARIAPELYIGECSHVASWKKTKEIEIVDVEKLSLDDWWQRLEAAVEKSPHHSLLVIVWGWKEFFESAALKTAYTAYVLDINTPVLLYDWPSNQGNDAFGYLRAQKLTDHCGRDLGRLLAEVDSRVAPERLWLTGSSLGCQVICNAFDWMVGQASLADDQLELDHVVLSAPDVSDDEFNSQFKEQLSVLSRNLSVYVNSNDKALLLSTWINRARRLGRQPPEAPDQLEEMIDLLELEVAGAKGIFVIDSTPISRTRNYHHYFTDSPEFFDDLHMRLLDEPPRVSRRLYRITYRDEIGYWILWGYEVE